MERKVKYDYAFKLECVKLVLEEHFSCEYVSNLKGLNKSNVWRWVNFYKEFGASGLLPRQNRNYSIVYKLQVLQSIKSDYLSLSEACLKFNITSESVIIKWQRDFANFGVEGLQPKPKGRLKSMSNYKRKKRKSDKPLTREEELLQENESLRCQIDILKKLHALIQAEEKAKRHKS
ncbi:helix-turn-helix domain-containing protein [Flavobacterium sp. HNIBRBA15423]|uniref:helix-turn-helix domain-containing protein n=1 Tax=Flavobacterium sp. HNIBRBA15423 TaxID=3458683 RepID=UPI004044A0BF